MQKDDWKEDMDELWDLSQGLEGVEVTRDWPYGLKHDAKTAKIPGVDNDPQKLYDWMHKEFGHCVLGRWQFIYKKGGNRVSVLRSGASFGEYEVYQVEGSPESYHGPERFPTAAGALERIKQLLK